MKLLEYLELLMTLLVNQPQTSNVNDKDSYFMQQAIRQAYKGLKAREVPIGAVCVYEDRIIAEAYNAPIQTHDPTAHAEIICLRKAGAFLNNYRIVNST